MENDNNNQLEEEYNETDFEKKERNLLFGNLPQRTINIIKIIFMVGLTITMGILAFVIFKYGSAIKADPCEFCDCVRNLRFK